MVPPEPFGYTALVARESTEQQGCYLKEEYDWLVDFMSLVYDNIFVTSKAVIVW